jgi:hypothetical protein
MFGFVFGTACLVGLVAVVASGRRHRHRHFRYGRHGLGPRAALQGALERLDTAPGQEKVILGAVDELVERARETARDVRGTRKALAEALRGAQIDQARLDDVLGRQEAALANLRAAGLDAVRKIHEALDERQRKILGDMIESGPHFFGPWSHRHAC